MIARLWWLPTIAAVLVGGGSSEPMVTAQQDPASTTAPVQSSTSLHRAWMLEVLDLDSLGAAKVYSEIVADRRPLNLVRWVAAARLAELHRLDIDRGGPSIDFTDVPDELRTAFADADTTLHIEPLVRKVSREPEAVLLEIATEAGSLPNFRPIVETAESWFVDQSGPSPLDRRRQRRAAFNNRPPFTDRVFALWILRDELRGRRNQADEKRSNYFILWQPPESTATPEVELARFRINIEALLAEREWTGYYQRRHRRLKTTVEELAADDPAAAMALVRRLPRYAERLLAPIPEEDR